MRVLVTGGSGFIGSHVVNKLRDQGITVRIYDLVTPTFRSDIEFFRESILNLEALCTALEQVDAVMHLAAVADVKEVFEDPHYAEEVNVRGTINVLEAMRRTDVKRLVYGSTIWVYDGSNDRVVDETSPLHSPAHLYTATKLAGEYYCRGYSNLYGLEPTILRCGIPYGPRSRAGAVIPTLVQKAFRGEALTIAGDGSQFRKFVYVEDLAAGIVLALKPVAKNRTYNLDGAERISIREIAEAIQANLGPLPIEYVPTRVADFGGKEISSRRAYEELSWKTHTRFKDGLRIYINWFEGESGQGGAAKRMMEGGFRRVDA
jgi:UDP-glucose 4-epimerase